MKKSLFLLWTLLLFQVFSSVFVYAGTPPANPYNPVDTGSYHINFLYNTNFVMAYSSDEPFLVVNNTPPNSDIIMAKGNVYNNVWTGSSWFQSTNTYNYYASYTAVTSTDLQEDNNFRYLDPAIESWPLGSGIQWAASTEATPTPSPTPTPVYTDNELLYQIKDNTEETSSWLAEMMTIPDDIYDSTVTIVSSIADLPADIATSVTASISTLLDSLFVPSDDYLEMQYAALKTAVDAKWDLTSVYNALDVFTNSTADGVFAPVEFTWAGTTVDMLPVEAMNPYIPTLHKILYIYVFYRLVIYNFNNFYFLVRGEYYFQSGGED